MKVQKGAERVSDAVAEDTFDVARLRGLYPAIGDGTAYLDGPFSAMQPESVIRSIAAALRGSPAQPGARTVRSRRTATTVTQARQALADLVGGTPECVQLGSTLAALNTQLAEVASWNWRFGDEIVLSRLDSGSTRNPWERAARSAGAGIRWAEVDLESGELPTWQYERLLGPHTRLVTVSLANPALGVVPDVRAIADLAHSHGALVLVDLGAAIPHVSIDLLEIGADIVAFSTATFGGPTVAALVTRPALLDEITDGTGRVAPTAEIGPLPVELLGGVTAAVDHLAGMDEFARGSRRDRLVSSINAAGHYTAGLLEHFTYGLSHQPHVTVLGGLHDRLPVIAFTVAGHSPESVADALSRLGVSVWTGWTDQSALLESFGADELGGAIFAGFMPHTTPAEIDLLLDGLYTLR